MIKDSGDRREFEDEEWRPVVGFEKYYDISNYGRVRSKREKTRIKDKENRIMCQKTDNKGYQRVNLNADGKFKACLVSRLVAEAFIPNPDGYPLVGHDDDDKQNNHVSNLYWTHPAENLSHNGLRENLMEKRANKMPKIIEAISNPVIGTNIETGEDIRFSSMQEAKRNGFDSGKISLCCAGKRKTHKGYEWRKL